MLGLWDSAKKSFPKETGHMIRLWRISWRIAPRVTLAAAALALIPAFAVGILAGKQFNTTIVNPNIILPPTGVQTTTAPPKPNTSDDISTLSDADLISYTARFASGLRSFETNSIIERENLLMTYQPLMPSNPTGLQAVSNENNKRWTENIARVEEMHSRETAEFKDDYLQPSIRLRDEIMRRLQRRGIFIEIQKPMPKPTPTSPQVYLPIIAFSGILAGSTPIADMADFLEYAAGRLR